MSNPQQEFSSEQFMRYAAECMRLASLARAPTRTMARSRPMRRLSRARMKWMRQMWERLRHPPKRYRKFATN
jgi:hypothetical protein